MFSRIFTSLSEARRGRLVRTISVTITILFLAEIFHVLTSDVMRPNGFDLLWLGLTTAAICLWVHVFFVVPSRDPDGIHHQDANRAHLRQIMQDRFAQK